MRKGGMPNIPPSFTIVWRYIPMGELLSGLNSFTNALPGAVSQGLIWGIMAIGLYITYQVLELSDLTVDGSFCTGGAVCVMAILGGCNVWVAMLLAMIAGMAAGAVTGFFHTKCGIPAILSGILTQLGLWSVNLAIMDMSATQRLDVNKFDVVVSLRFIKEVAKGTKAFYFHPILVVALITAVVIAILYWFFGTEKGASIRATGANEHMARAQGINTNANKMIGLMLANGLVAFSGALFAQYNGSAEINMGRGAIVIGLASIIIGDVLFGKLFKNFAFKLLAVSFGAIIYYIVIQAVLTLLKVDSQYLKLMSAAIVAIFLTVPNLKGHHKKHKKEVPACSK